MSKLHVIIIVKNNLDLWDSTESQEYTNNIHEYNTVCRYNTTKSYI